MDPAPGVRWPTEFPVAVKVIEWRTFGPLPVRLQAARCKLWYMKTGQPKRPRRKAATPARAPAKSVAARSKKPKPEVGKSQAPAQPPPYWLSDVPTKSKKRPKIPGIIGPVSLEDAIAAATRIGLLTPTGRQGKLYRTKRKADAS